MLQFFSELWNMSRGGYLDGEENDQRLPGFCKGPTWEADPPVKDENGFGMIRDADMLFMS